MAFNFSNIISDNITVTYPTLPPLSIEYLVVAGGGGGGGGGGAGAGAVGGIGISAASYTAGPGGAGCSSCITGSTVFYAGGGGGGTLLGRPLSCPGAQALGGIGGGGNGGRYTSPLFTSGETNTGGGGGSSGYIGGANGGSGIVVIKFPSSYSITIDPGLTACQSSVGPYNIACFLSGTGNISFS